MYPNLIYKENIIFNEKQNVFISNIKYIAYIYIYICICICICICIYMYVCMYGSEADNIIKASTNLTWLDQHSRKQNKKQKNIIIEHSRLQNQSLDSHYACRQKSGGSADRTPVLSSIIKTLTSLCHLLWLTTFSEDPLKQTSGTSWTEEYGVYVPTCTYLGTNTRHAGAHYKGLLGVRLCSCGPYWCEASDRWA